MIARAAPSISAMRPRTSRERSQPVASGEGGDGGERPEERAPEGAVEGGAGGDVAADEEALAVGEPDGQRGDLGRARAVGAVEVERGPAAAGRDRRRPAAEVAGDPAAVGVDEQVDGVAVGRVRQPLADAGGERRRAAAGEVVGEAADLGLHHRLLLGVDDAADAPVDRAEHQRRGERDQHEVRRDQAHGGVAEHAASGAGGELVAGAAHGVDERRLALGVDLAAEPADVHVDHVGAAGRSGSPRPLRAAWCG